jgi:hypothetical protein
MSFKFEMSDVKDSLTHLYTYVAEIADEKTWKTDPILSDSSIATRIRFPHPNAVAKDIKANSEPFSSIEINLQKPYAPQVFVELAYTSKKASARFCDILEDRNKVIRDEFFAMLRNLDGCTVKLQARTTFKNNSFVKSEDIFVAPSDSVSLDDIVQNFKKVIDACSISEISEDGKVAKYKGPCISVGRDFSIDDLALQDSSFDKIIGSFRAFMLSEPKILSEKDIEKTKKERKKIEGKNKFHIILSNRADVQFYCRLTKPEFERIPDNIGVVVWNIESCEEKKYIRGALKLVSEI